MGWAGKSKRGVEGRCEVVFDIDKWMRQGSVESLTSSKDRTRIRTDVWSWSPKEEGGRWDIKRSRR